MAMFFVKVYFDFEERTDELNDIEKGRLLLAMLRYARTGEKPDLKGNERFCFSYFKGAIDHEREVYNSKLENGKKGGRPTVEKPNKTEINRNKPNETESNLPFKSNKSNKTNISSGDNIPFRDNNPPESPLEGEPSELVEVVNAFIEHCKKLKKPKTDYAIRRLVNKLHREYSSTEEKIAALNQSIDRGWIDVYPLKDNYSKQNGNIFVQLAREGNL